jgi:hypothetical protein
MGRIVALVNTQGATQPAENKANVTTTTQGLPSWFCKPSRNQHVYKSAMYVTCSVCACRNTRCCCCCFCWMHKLHQQGVASCYTPCCSIVYLRTSRYAALVAVLVVQSCTSLAGPAASSAGHQQCCCSSCSTRCLCAAC